MTFDLTIPQSNHRTVGGTSGIGETTAREFVRYTTSPRIYLIGRSQEAASKLITEFKDINSSAQINFIKSDVALLKNVDDAVAQIKAKESAVNLLCLSAGIFTFAGRNETAEGLDTKFSLHYYSRMRFTQGLMPLLARAAETPAEGGKVPMARVISVLGAGHEGKINTDDFSLKNSYSLGNCATHAQTANTLAPHALWASDPATKGVTFIHSAPGGVNTSISTKAPGPAKWALRAMFPVVNLLMPSMINTVQESGERHVWAATADEFGKGGVVLLAPKSEVIKSSPLVESYLKEGTDRKVWEHTLEVYKKICEEGGKY